MPAGLPCSQTSLASALTAHEACAANGSRLIDDPVLNRVIVLMVVTSLFGPILTDIFGKRLAATSGSSEVTASQNAAKPE
jgi:Na+:H+ antiporter